MDRRSWPWKKKSSEKTVLAPDSAIASLASATSQGDQDDPKKVNFVQISVESYAHLTDLEDQVKILNDQVDVLNEKLSVAHSEISTKESLVKQHTKVAEDAVSGWEKAEAEALALKNQLEFVTLLKLTAEDRASHLDGALKECMKQVRNLKEEHEQKLHQTVLTKTKQWDKIKLELEAKIIELDKEILRSFAENATLSRSLHEHSDVLMKISEEKSQAEVEIELLRTDIQSCEKEINSLKYELHIISKELEIRNEEKNMSVRSAEAANKQYLEGVKKTAKLEAECQRLRGLVRKKLPGPAALAQMKLEVESLGRDYGETRIRRSPVKNSSSHLTPLPEFSLDIAQQCHKETEFLSARLLASEEETKMLKEALAKRNSELQASRTLCAKTASKLRIFEAQMQVLNQHRVPQNLNSEIPTKGSSSHNASNPPSLTSISEDGVDEESRYGESWAATLMSELSHFNKEKNVGKTNRVDNSIHQLMDDFLEMERLACSSTESCGAISTPDSSTNRIESEDHSTLFDTGNPQLEKQPDFDASEKLTSSDEDLSEAKLESDVNQVSLSKLRSRLSMIFDSEAKDADTGTILEEIKHVLQDIKDTLPQCSPSYDSMELHSADATCNQQDCPKDTGENVDSEISLAQDASPGLESKVNIEQELATVVSHIHGFVLSLGKESIAIQNGSPQGHVFRQGIERFSDSVSKVLCSKMSAVDFLVDLSYVLAQAGELSISVLSYKGSGGETDSSDCIDKVTLLENQVVQDDPLTESFPSDCAHISRSTSGPEALHEGSSCTDFEIKAPLCKCMLELEELKSEKTKMAMDLARCTENLEQTEFQLQETKHLLAELKPQLESSQKSNSLAETQLKCMVESYRTLETHAQELEAEVDLLRTKVETRDNELQEEKQNHRDALAGCKDLQEQIESRESCSVCSLSSAAGIDVKSKQEMDIAAATDKLAECQETIFLLGRQLKSFHPSLEHGYSPCSEKSQTNYNFMEEGLCPSSLKPQDMNGIQDLNYTEMESVASSSNVLSKEGRASPSDAFVSPSSPSETEAKLILRSPINSKHPKDSPTKSSSSSSSGTTAEKHPRSFSRFFSSKSKNGH